MPSLKDLLKIEASNGATTSIASLRNLPGRSPDLEFLIVEALRIIPSTVIWRNLKGSPSYPI